MEFNFLKQKDFICFKGKATEKQRERRRVSIHQFTLQMTAHLPKWAGEQPVLELAPIYEVGTTGSNLNQPLSRILHKSAAFQFQLSYFVDGHIFEGRNSVFG